MIFNIIMLLYSRVSPSWVSKVYENFLYRAFLGNINSVRCICTILYTYCFCLKHLVFRFPMSINIHIIIESPSTCPCFVMIPLPHRGFFDGHVVGIPGSPGPTSMWFLYAAQYKGVSSKEFTCSKSAPHPGMSGAIDLRSTAA